MATNQTAKFTLAVDDQVSAPAKTAANSLEQFRASIEASQTKVKELGGALRGLKGSSDAVKAAKDELRASMDAEKNSISVNTLALLKQGTTYDALASKSRKLAKDTDELKKKTDSDAAKTAAEKTARLTDALKNAGGPVGQLTSGVEGLSKSFSGAGAEMAVTAGVVAGVVAAIAAVTVGAVAATVAFGKFVVSSGDAARSAGLLRLAVTGSAEDAKHLGNQVDLLATKIATPKAALNDLAVELRRTRLSGTEIVNTFNAVGQAGAAMGEGVGNKFKDMLTRGQMVQRLRINPLELMGTGLDFDDIAKPLAEKMHVGLGAARQALLQQGAPLEAGAQALRDAIEKKFGAINSKKMLSLDTQMEKFQETLGGLTKNINLEPLLLSVQKFFHLFDESTTTGVAIKKLVTVFGTELVDSMVKAEPVAEKFLKGLVQGALQVGTWFNKAQYAIQQTFKGIDTDSLVNLNDVMAGGKVIVEGFGIALAAVGVAAAGLALSFATIVGEIGKITTAMEGVKIAAKNKDAKGIGLNLGNGVVAGLELSKGPVQIAMEKLGGFGLAALIKKTEVHSPSKKTERVGKGLGQGLVVGVDAEQSNVDRAMANMVKLPDAPSSRASSGGGTQQQAPQIIVHINAPGATREAVDAMSSPSFLAQMVKTLEDARATGGTSSR